MNWIKTLWNKLVNKTSVSPTLVVVEEEEDEGGIADDEGGEDDEGTEADD